MATWFREGILFVPFQIHNSRLYSSSHLDDWGGWVDVVRTLKSSVTFFKQKSLTNTKKMRFTEVYWRDVILSVS